MLAMAAVYLTCEIVLRRRSKGRRGSLDSATRAIVLAPVAIYLTAAVVLSTGSWSILGLTSVLVVVGLPIGLGASHRALRPEAAPSASIVVAVGLSVAGLLAVWLAHAN